jgi:hypothetical protein
MLIKFTPKVEHLKCVVLTPKEGLKLTRTIVKLLPGTNEVTNDEWKAMRGNIVSELENGEISILAQKVSAGRGKVGGVKAKDLKEMPVNIAIKYVSECNNPDTLEKWYAEITNEEVRLAITKKFKKLELELPEDKIPDTPNGSPMSLEEFDEDENEDEDEETDDSDLNDEDSEEDNETDEDDSEEVNFSEMTNAELKAECEKRGIDTKKFSKKADFIEALTNPSEE